MPPRPKKPVAPLPPPKEVKILMLHGFTQSGPLFRSKTRAVEKLLVKALAPDRLLPVLFYPTAPVLLRPQDIPGYEPKADEAEEDQQRDSWGWWLRDADNNYARFDEGMTSLATAITEAGGVDAVMGFSQGAGAAAILAAALEQPPRQHPPTATWVEAVRAANKHRPLRFAVIYSGFLPQPDSLRWLYEPHIRTPTMHVRGSLDTIVSETRSEALADHCVDPEMIVHPGSHYVPVSRDKVLPLVPFIKKHCAGLQADSAEATAKEATKDASEDSIEDAIDAFAKADAAVTVEA